MVTYSLITQYVTKNVNEVPTASEEIHSAVKRASRKNTNPIACSECDCKISIYCNHLIFMLSSNAIKLKCVEDYGYDNSREFEKKHEIILIDRILTFSLSYLHFLLIVPYQLYIGISSRFLLSSLFFPMPSDYVYFTEIIILLTLGVLFICFCHKSTNFRDRRVRFH
ncbi:hypothetical protein BpHYR1_008183 [Brachionus plicatilis]|uniref:Uncharacterized protein n=1 Tax=Brachionus plicatilis TaxID=10195 RepID=A0A3M7Q638_BRAPC|nr:hypothetical protein BpHYR1_008183 [Brachionus plicatilis]